VLYGLALGLVYPWVHAIVQKRLNAKDGKRHPLFHEAINKNKPDLTGPMAGIRGGK